MKKDADELKKENEKLKKENEELKQSESGKLKEQNEDVKKENETLKEKLEAERSSTHQLQMEVMTYQQLATIPTQRKGTWSGDIEDEEWRTIRREVDKLRVQSEQLEKDVKTKSREVDKLEARNELLEKDAKNMNLEKESQGPWGARAREVAEPDDELLKENEQLKARVKRVKLLLSLPE